MTVYEYVFPAGFEGEEHAAEAAEFAYVHVSLNESKKPARVLVVLLKGRP